jgi:hypothetical protein
VEKTGELPMAYYRSMMARSEENHDAPTSEEKGQLEI